MPPAACSSCCGYWKTRRARSPRRCERPRRARTRAGRGGVSRLAPRRARKRLRRPPPRRHVDERLLGAAAPPPAAWALVVAERVEGVPRGRGRRRCSVRIRARILLRVVLDLRL